MKNVSTAQKLQELPVGSIIAEKDAENVLYRLNSGWVTLADLKTEPDGEIAGKRFNVLRHGYHDHSGDTLTPILPEPEFRGTMSAFWLDDVVFATKSNNSIHIEIDNSRLDVTSAREFAHAVLAAINFIEQEPDQPQRPDWAHEYMRYDGNGGWVCDGCPLESCDCTEQ